MSANTENADDNVGLNIRAYANGAWFDVPNDGRLDICLSDGRKSYRLTETPDYKLNVEARTCRPRLEVVGNNIIIDDRCAN